MSLLELRRARAPLAALLLAGLAACGGAGGAPPPRVEWSLEPTPPRVGAVTLRFSLADAAGAPLELESVEVEANMSHPGMVPELAAARGLGAGRYEAELELTMGGDWFLLFRGALPDGTPFEVHSDLPGVLGE